MLMVRDLHGQTYDIVTVTKQFFGETSMASEFRPERHLDVKGKVKGKVKGEALPSPTVQYYKYTRPDSHSPESGGP